jgi:hydroxyacylglutathione hydrolase
MLFRQLFDTSLSQYSYFIGCQETGEAVVVDPLRDAGQYIALAEAEGMRIAAVTETHIHADFCSGARELAHRAGAQLFLSGLGGPDWRYGFAAEDRAVELTDGDVIVIGRITLTAMHTPGHTPEHIVFLVTDGAASSEPVGMLSGDFLFVGDVGRPDLLETVAHQVGTMERSARALRHSLERLALLPDYLQIWPGHGAGSACGRALGAIPQSTLGYERRVNWALQPQSEAQFVSEVLRGQPDAPSYFAVMKRMNRDGPTLLSGVPSARIQSGFDAQEWSHRDGLVIDTRPADQFALGHVRRSLSIPGNKSFSTWFGAVIDYESDAWLLVSSEAEGVRLVRELMHIGYDRVAGLSLAADALEGIAHESLAQRSAASLAGVIGEPAVIVLDVRSRTEFAHAHIPGARNIPLAELPRRLREVPTDSTVIAQCASGGRSSIAASLLLLAGVERVENLYGGMQAWTNGGFTVSRVVSHPGDGAT